jgi:hypothetical protein
MVRRTVGALGAVLLLGGLCCAPCALVASEVAQSTKLYPVDEWDADASLAQFRGRLREIVRRRDWPRLRENLDASIQNSFGGDGGIPEFQQMWHPEKASSRLWPILSELLRFGGCFTSQERDEFYTPYVFARFPDTLDAFTYAVILGKAVKVLAGSSPSAKVVGILNYDIVELLPEASEARGRPDSWVRIRVRDLEGYVMKGSLRSPIDYRLGLQRSGRAWRIVALVAGD